MFLMSEPRPTVLYVDDEENDRFLLQLAFEQAEVGAPVQVAEDGVEALEYLLGTGRFTDRTAYPVPTVVLLDFKLPRLSGLQVLERIRQEPALQGLPVILFSSSEQASDREQAKALGANDYIVKPTSMDGFVAFARQLHETWLTAPR